MTQPNLLPCPFCGGAPITQEYPPHQHHFTINGEKFPDHPGSFAIECCGAGMIDDTMERVSERWNKRFQPVTEPYSWVPEDELPENYPYHAMYPFSKVDGIRWFPVFLPPQTENELRNDNAKLREINVALNAVIRFAAQNEDRKRFLELIIDRRFDLIRCEFPDAPAEIFAPVEPVKNPPNYIAIDLQDGRFAIKDSTGNTRVILGTVESSDEAITDMEG